MNSNIEVNAMSCINRCQNERGAALVISLMFLAILGLLGTTAVVLTTTDMQIGANYKTNAIAFYDADAGAIYAIAKMEEGLKAYPQTFTATDGDSLRDMGIGETISLVAFTAPSGFNFSYEPPGLTKIADKMFSFTTNGAGLNNSKTIIATTCKTVPVIEFGVFGDKKVDLGNTAGVYSYSHTDTPSPTIGGSTEEGDIGSNESVILRNLSVVDGDVALGENPAGTDGVLTDLGGIVSGVNGDDIDRVDPDPLALCIAGGEYATNLSTYSGVNDNVLAVETPVGANTIIAGPEIDIKNNETLTLKGKVGGANYYFTEVLVRNNGILYIDTTPHPTITDALGNPARRPVNIYVTGTFDAITGSQVINTTDPSCTDPTDPAGTAPSCGCCDTASPPNYTCTLGAPSDFAIFASSQSSTDKISIGNSVEFAGFIYAPYITVRLDNSADIYGAIIAREVEIVNSVHIFFDTDMADDYVPRELALTTWRDVRD